ncbi:uncharacterized protein C8Q71DRAFT_718759 [Rhodofomes roseus]|uniref:Uncharacterized protein n=1 Tax=Rhodofomes roseus TaxID=34475 RepID=A0ABQ8JXS7_9APHY|nr:uncharacterized protein C8Q71DRAFT_718759 [Rhodofomes roseus]KAH9829032.1 hypothetical protein C8Q71DRAFT_718759 [Rhodofomes roseus]
MYQWPDPLDLPTAVDENLHSCMTHAKPFPHPTPTTKTAYTDASFEQRVISYNVLMGNVCKKQRDAIKADPTGFLAVVPYGAGNCYFEDNPRAHLDIQDFVRSLRFLRPTTEEISKSVRETNKDIRDCFGKPWTLFLHGGSQCLRKFLLYQQTFAISERIAFSVVPLDPNIFSWAICNLVGDGITPTLKDTILAGVKRWLWKDDAFRAHIDKVLAREGVPGSVNEQVLYVTNSYTLVLIHKKDERGNPAAIAQLRGKPITSNMANHLTYLQLVCDGNYWIALNHLKTRGQGVECQLCKADTHPTWDCPLHQTPGWYGPKYDGAERHEDQAKRARDDDGFTTVTAQGSSSRGRGCGGQRATRGHGY